jgi:hypothetical protein
MRTTRGALALVVVLAAASCGVPGADHDRAAVEARTCVSFLRRLGRPPATLAAVDPAVFLEVRDTYLRSGRPFSTLEPFVKACRSFG